jgi:hypothetical protein
MSDMSQLNLNTSRTNMDGFRTGGGISSDTVAGIVALAIGVAVLIVAIYMISKRGSNGNGVAVAASNPTAASPPTVVQLAPSVRWDDRWGHGWGGGPGWRGPAGRPYDRYRWGSDPRWGARPRWRHG